MMLLRQRSISAIFLSSFGLILNSILACLLNQLDKLLKTASLFAKSIGQTVEDGVTVCHKLLSRIAENPQAADGNGYMQ